MPFALINGSLINQALRHKNGFTSAARDTDCEPPSAKKWVQSFLGIESTAKQLFCWCVWMRSVRKKAKFTSRFRKTANEIILQLRNKGNMKIASSSYYFLLWRVSSSCCVVVLFNYKWYAVHFITKYIKIYIQYFFFFLFFSS